MKLSSTLTTLSIGLATASPLVTRANHGQQGSNAPAAASTDEVADHEYGQAVPGHHGSSRPHNFGVPGKEVAGTESAVNGNPAPDSNHGNSSASGAKQGYDSDTSQDGQDSPDDQTDSESDNGNRQPNVPNVRSRRIRKRAAQASKQGYNSDTSNDGHDSPDDNTDSESENGRRGQTASPGRARRLRRRATRAPKKNSSHTDDYNTTENFSELAY
ncbi:hypothetical protein ED733_002719 [Metarhizium rileyi]|uniref:Uncharacterized protein n=1 Tax=Metarhizium rileyi (strain RCEF 4871) TaxID=1649241 RepID=A0A5C6G7F2_METRR|nr:hypothetical protein ED733_002719 [Metarhizium rileyi]